MNAYSETAEKVFLALLTASNSNPTISGFAERVAQAITLYDAGFIKRGPIGSFLLFVPRHVPLNYLLDVLAEEWLGGRPWDESRPFFHIDCSRLTIFNPMVSLELHGGRVGFGGEGATIMPLLGRINDPHLAIRGGDFLRKVDSWWGYFRRANVRQEGLLRNRAIYDALRENLRLTIEAERKRYEEELNEESEFRSVVVFDDLSYITHPEVFRAMQNVIEKGSELVWPNESVDFSHSLVVAIVYDDINESWKARAGYKLEDAADQPGARAHTYIREIPQLAGLTQLMGDNIFTFPKRSLEDQCAQVILRMKDMQRRFAEAGIFVEWSQDFPQGLARGTFDRDTKAYTDGRMERELQEQVMNPMAGYLLAGKLKHGAKIHFDVTGEEEGAFPVRCTIKDEGDGAILTASDIRGVWEGRKTVGLNRDQALALVRSDERLAHLHGEALRLLKPDA